ncbi:exodeoxyribonuclease VII large subunit [Hydrogenimonas sp.]
MNAVTVSELNERIKSLLESHFIQVRVEGEVSRITYHTSGHLYFTIKDAKSKIDCVMFRSNAQRLRFRIEEGQHLVLSGAVTVYVPRGNYQLMVQHAEPYGAGALAVAFEQLKRKLQAEGLFDAARKRPMPKTVRHIAVVTSKSGAAIQDMIRVASKRWPMLKITLIDTLVQGAGAAEEIARHLRYADTLGADVIVVGRGGGSVEDLWAFNEEVVARAIADSRTPVVSAVGHEVDTLISDFVADLRAPTPSAAMEMILPDMAEVLMTLDEWMERMGRRMGQILAQKSHLLDQMRNRLESHALSRRIELQREEVALLRRGLRERMARLLGHKEGLRAPLVRSMASEMAHLLARKEAEWRAAASKMAALEPKNRVAEGFVQLVKDGKAVRLQSLKEGDEVRLEDGEWVASASIEALHPIKA